MTFFLVSEDIIFLEPKVNFKQQTYTGTHLCVHVYSTCAVVKFKVYKMGVHAYIL